MEHIESISKALSYVCLALLTGALLFKAISPKHRPQFHYPLKWMLIAALVFPLLAFSSIARTTMVLMERFQYSFPEMLFQVVFTFEIGQSWLFTLFFSFLLFVLLLSAGQEISRTLAITGLLGVLVIILSQTYTGHPASLTTWGGFINHAFHYIAISLWIGSVFIAGWFTKDSDRWAAYVRWFTPFAIICVGIVIASGLLMTQYISSEFMRSWALTYGQALLLKHILIVPLLVYGLMNGFLMKRRLDRSANHQPHQWLRAESFAALFIFAVTSFLIVQSPPHDMSQTLMFLEPSPMFEWFHPVSVEPAMLVGLGWSSVGMLFVSLSIVFLTLMLWSYTRQSNAYLTLIYALGFTLSFYVAVMLSICIDYLF